MKFVFYIAEGKSREAPLCEAWVKGCRMTGDHVTVAPNRGDPIPADVAIMVGLKSIVLREACVAAGQRVLIFDKGYDRRDDWWRMAIDAHQPTDYLGKIPRDYARAAAQGWNPKPWRQPHPASPVIIAGGGRKYYITHDLPEPAEYVAELVRDIRAAGCTRKIWYRPKPSMSDVVPVAGTTLSRHKSIYEILDDAHALITYGSNACFEAMLAGVPSIVLGDAIAGPISSRQIDDIEDPLLAPDGGRLSLLASLAYCQFRASEIANGWGVNEIKTQLREVVSGTSRDI
jgi:hypothetical protein